MISLKKIFFFICCLFPSILIANNHQIGFELNYGSLVKKTRPKESFQSGFQLQFYPQNLKFNYYQIYFQGGWEYLKTNEVKNNYKNSTQNVSFGPVLKIGIPLIKTPIFNPFIFVGVSPGYITQAKFGTLNHGMNFTFRDTLGTGLLLGKKQNLIVSFSYVHYSHLLGSPNPGIDIPLQLAFSYLFNL
jgi:hypothetical protein